MQPIWFSTATVETYDSEEFRFTSGRVGIAVEGVEPTKPFVPSVSMSQSDSSPFSMKSLVDSKRW